MNKIKIGDKVSWSFRDQEQFDRDEPVVKGVNTPTSNGVVISDEIDGCIKVHVTHYYKKGYSITFLNEVFDPYDADINAKLLTVIGKAEVLIK